MPFYTGPYGCYAPLRSSIGVGPRGDSVTVNVLVGSDGSCRLQFVNSSTGEVIDTTPDLAFTFDDFTPQQLDDLRSDITSVYYRKDDAVITTSGTNTTTIPIPFEDFRATDILVVSVEGLTIAQGTDYTVSDGNVVLASPITHAGTAVGLTRMTGIALTAEDLDAIVAEKIATNVSEWLDEHPEAIGTAVVQEITQIAESAESAADEAVETATAASAAAGRAESSATSALTAAQEASSDVESLAARFPADYPRTNLGGNGVDAYFACRNGMAYLEVTGTVSYESAWASTTICTLPNGYRNTEVIQAPMTMAGQRSSGTPRLLLGQNGVVTTDGNGAALGASKSVSAFVCWPVFA